MRSGLVNSLRAAKEANTTTAKLSRTNDAAAEPSSSTVRHLSSDSPASASRHSSSPSPRPQDTALPLSNRRPAQQADLPDLNHPSLKQSRKYQISEDEYRLCANFSVPEDFTPVPSPEDFLLARINATMVKPTSEHSYKPINSLHESGNQVIARPKPRTYSNKRYNHIPGGFMEGQNQYRSRKEIETPGSSRSYINLDEQPRQLDVSGSAKRRKLRHNSSPQEVINLDDDDDIQIAASSPLRSTADTVNLTRNSPSIVSSQLQSRKSPSLGHVPPSEFENTNRLVDPRRKKARKSPANGTERQVRTSPDITVNPARMIDNSRHPVSVVISRRAPPREQNSRKLILEDLQQGKDGQRISAQKGQHQLSANPGRTSEYWPNAEINESTELRKTESRKAQRMKYLNSPPSKSIPVIEDHGSEDELHTSIAEPSFTRTKGRKSIMRSRPSADELSNASIWPNDEGWPLNFARSHDFEMWGPDLWLRKGNTKDSFRVVGRNSSDGVLSESTLNLQKVNLVKADCSSRIRLQGGQSHGQNIYLFDLEFANLHEFNIFYAFHAEKAAVTASKNPSSNFEILFSKPLPKNEKIRKLSSTEHSASAPIKAEANMNENRPRGEFMNKLFSMKKNMPAAHTDESDKATARISSTRPTRTTRANGPVYAEVEEIDYPEVEKFSEVHGLGKPWDKPLQYGSGRRRALVEFTDLPRLDEGEFLNDSLIDFYMIYLFDQAKVPADKVYYHNTHFYSTLTRNTGRKSPINYQAVKRWTSKDDIFSHDYIMVPINEAAHWYLAIICNVSNIARKPAVEEIDDSDQEAPKQVSDVAEILPVELDEDEVIEVSKFTPTDTPSPSSPVPEVAATEPNNDPNLFEEANIDLIKPDAIERDQSAASGSEEGRLTPAETIGISQLSLEDDSIPKSIFSDTPVSAPAKKKTKRKSGPILRKRNPDEPVIIILDSLGISRTGAVKALKQYILEEGKDKRGMDAIINEQGFYAKDSQIPMQENLSDCGVYLLGYTQKFFEDPDRFKTRMLTGEMTTESDWPDMAMPQMRATMREILFKLNETQREERRLAKRGAQKKSVQTNASKAEAPKTVPKQEEPSKVKSPQLSEEKRLDTLPANSTAEQATESPLRVPILRLGSPFSPRRITRKEQSLGPVNKVSDSPPILRSSPIHHHARIGHQVTIATTSPTARKSPRKRSREEAAITEDALSSAVGQPRRDAHPTSPKKRFVEATDGEKPNTEPTRKKRLTSEPPPTTREHVQINVADEPGSRPGTSDHPIPIDDSQDQSALALHSSTPARLHSKHRRTRSTETPRTARAEPLTEDAEESTTADEAVVAETPEYERSSPRVEEE